MEYNTQREQLKITDYGRNVCKMIEKAKTLPSRDERNRMAHVIIDTMALVNPKVKERSDYKHILWDHLMLLADFDLDVDCPYAVKKEEAETLKPHHIAYSDSQITYRHYGRALEDMIKAVAKMPEGDERALLTRQIAHTMKRQYLQWNRDSVDDALISEQLSELSGGRLTLSADFQFQDSKVYIDAMAAAMAKRENGSKKKKKKKKKASQI